MASICEEALGADFRKLHPKIQEQFGFSSKDHRVGIGRGIMEKIWHGPFYILPGLHVGAQRNIMFPEQGTNVPFTIEHFAYLDNFGRETFTWLRTFDIGTQRRFDEYMVGTDMPKQVLFYLGTHQHLAVDMEMSVTEYGGLRLRSDKQRLYEDWITFKFPMLFSGRCDVHEWYDDELEKYSIDVCVSNPWMGDIFGCNGTFDLEWLQFETTPARVRPLREECRV